MTGGRVAARVVIVVAILTMVGSIIGLRHHLDPYDIVTGGDIGGYMSPRLAFGHSSSAGWLVWVFVGLFLVSIVERSPATTRIRRRIAESGSSNSRRWPRCGIPDR